MCVFDKVKCPYPHLLPQTTCSRTYLCFMCESTHSWTMFVSFRDAHCLSRLFSSGFWSVCIKVSYIWPSVTVSSRWVRQLCKNNLYVFNRTTYNMSASVKNEHSGILDCQSSSSTTISSFLLCLIPGSPDPSKLLDSLFLSILSFQPPSASTCRLLSVQ